MLKIKFDRTIIRFHQNMWRDPALEKLHWIFYQKSYSTSVKDYIFPKFTYNLQSLNIILQSSSTHQSKSKYTNRIFNLHTQIKDKLKRNSATSVQFFRIANQEHEERILNKTIIDMPKGREGHKANKIKNTRRTKER